MLGLETVIGSRVPQTFLPDSVTDILKSDRFNSEYKVTSEEVNAQITALNGILKKTHISREPPEIPSYVEITADVTDFELAMTVPLAANMDLYPTDRYTIQKTIGTANSVCK